MDIMKWYDILFVGVPETTIFIFISLFILDGKVDFKSKSLYLKLILSNIIILSIIFVSRGFFNSLLYTSTASMTAYALCFKGVWEYNWRQSIIGGVITIFTLMGLEIITLPVANVMIENYSLMSLFGNRIILSLPPRILQMLIFIFIVRKHITLKNNELMISKWEDLNRDQKATIVIMLFCITTCVSMDTSYGDIFYKINFNPKDISLITNMTMMFIGSLLMIFCVLLLMFRTIRYESYKNILQRTPEEFIRKILESSTLEELQTYSKIFLQELQIARIVQIEKYLEHIKKTYSNMTYEIDENIVFADLDYTEIMHCIDNLICALKNDAKLFFSAKKEDSDMIITLKAYDISEVQYKAMQNTYRRLVYLKKEIAVKLQATTNLYYLNQNVICEIIIPLKKYLREEVLINENE